MAHAHRREGSRPPAALVASQVAPEPALQGENNVRYFTSRQAGGVGGISMVIDGMRAALRPALE